MKNAGRTNGNGGDDHGGKGGSRGTPPGSARRDPSRGGLGTLSGSPKSRSLTTVVDPVEGLEALPELPASERAFLTDGDIRVPVRRISVGGGEAPVEVYDPSGPRAADLRAGLPKLRQPWID